MKALFAILISLVLACPCPALAGRSCDLARPTAKGIEQSFDLAQRTQAALEELHDRKGTRVVVLARAGQDLRKYGLQYSHLGLAYRTVEANRPVWRVLHKLNDCGTSRAALYRQGIGEFFLDDLFQYRAAWIEPTAQLQDHLYPLLIDARVPIQLHHRPYNLVSYPWSLRYQQSNQWALEVIGSAQSGRGSRAQVQDWLRANRFEPAVIRLGALARLGGMVSQNNVFFDDHPPEKRFAGRIETVSVDSVFAWLQDRGLSDGGVMRIDGSKAR